VARELIARSGIDPAVLDEVIVGCVGPPYDQANVGRVLAMRAGVPKQVPAFTVGRNCASGMEAVAQAVTKIEAGRGSLFLCVGVEVMSAYPLVYGPQMTALFDRLSRARTLGERLAALASFRPRFLAPRIALMEGLTDPICGLIMGRTAEVLAREFAITRAEADRFALESHQRAKSARDSGRFAKEILPLVPLGAREGSAALEHDDGIRDQQTIEALAKLPPYFEKPDGVVTVGNSCGITDGATALLVASEERADELGPRPAGARARLRVRGARSPAHGARARVRQRQGARRSRRDARRDGRRRDQRGIRRAGARLREGFRQRRVRGQGARPFGGAGRARLRAHQSQRRRDRARSPGRRQRRAPRADGRARARSARQEPRAGDPVHRRRTGRGHGPRTRVRIPDGLELPADAPPEGACVRIERPEPGLA
jgi:acetyl-CoA acetyltransferase family protein